MYNIYLDTLSATIHIHGTTYLQFNSALSDLHSKVTEKRYHRIITELLVAQKK